MRRVTLIAICMVILSLCLPATALAADPASSWGEFKDAFSEAAELAKNNPIAAENAVEKAHSIFEKELEPELTGTKSNKELVQQYIHAAAGAAQRQDSLEVKVEAQKAKKTTLGLFLSTFEKHIKAGRVDQAKPWFDILADKFKYTESSDVVKNMDTVVADPKLAKKTGGKVVNSLVAKLIGKVAEEVDEALVAADPKGAAQDMDEAKILMAEGIGYFNAGQAYISERLGFEDAARVSGLLNQMDAALANGDIKLAKDAGEVAKDELAEMETAKKLSGSAFVQEISHIKATLSAAIKQEQAKKTDSAKKLIDEAWTGFTRIESQIRGLDAATYVRIEKIFGQIKEDPKVGPTQQLRNQFTRIVSINSGEAEAARATTSELIFTGFERIQPILFALLALLGIYPVYLISRAFGWRHKAWRNIGIFVILLIVPVFMEALGRFGVEMKISTLQAFSFTVNEWAKMAWAAIILVAFLFAIKGLREFCTQFGIKAFGVRQAPVEPMPEVDDDTNVEVLHQN